MVRGLAREVAGVAILAVVGGFLGDAGLRKSGVAVEGR